MATAIRFCDPVSGLLRPEAFDTASICASVTGDGGYVVEYGVAHGFEVEGVAVAGHLVSINLDPFPLALDVRRMRSVEVVTMPPFSLFLQPAGESMSVRSRRPGHFCAIELPTEWVDRVFARSLSFSPAYGVVDARLTEVMFGMKHELAAGSPSGPLYCDGLALAALSRLAHVVGIDASATDKRPLSETRLRAVRQHVETALGDRLRVDDLAAVAGLSVAHFARAFRAATGRAPHAYVMDRRLERARGLLASGIAVAEVAARCGFADQAHLARSFRRRYGITPTAFQRQRPRRRD